MEVDGDNLFTGHGGPMPTSRVVNAGFFGTVDDAFSSRSLFLPGIVKQATTPDTPTNASSLSEEEIIPQVKTRQCSLPTIYATCQPPEKLVYLSTNSATCQLSVPLSTT